jgi:hypothetical protein
MSENVTIIFYPYIYNNKIDFAGKKTYTRGQIAVDVLSKGGVTGVTERCVGCEVRGEREAAHLACTQPHFEEKYSVICK